MDFVLNYETSARKCYDGSNPLMKLQKDGANCNALWNPEDGVFLDSETSGAWSTTFTSSTTFLLSIFAGILATRILWNFQ